MAGKDGVSLTGTVGFVMSLYAPQSDLKVSGDGQIYGAIVAKKMDLSTMGTGALHVDEAVVGGSSSTTGGGIRILSMKIQLPQARTPSARIPCSTFV